MVDGDLEGFGSAKIAVENRDADRSTYISKIYAREDSSSSWTEVWDYDDYKSDSYISFYMESGSYQFLVRVIYPEYDGANDYYDDFTTDYYAFVSSQETTKIVFDGEKLILS